MRANSFNILILVLAFSSGRFYALPATVNSWNARMEIENPQKKGGFLTLLPGTAVQTDKSGVAFFHISYNGFSGWIRKDYLTVYNGSLSDIGSKPFLSKKIIREEGKDYLFLFNKGKLVKYNITDRAEDISQNVGDLGEIYQSPRNTLFLLKGISTNNSIVDNLELFDIASGKTLFIGSFREDTFEISGIKFSAGADFLGILFSVRGRQLLCIYRTDSGAMCTYSTDASGFNWRGSLLVLNDNKNFWAYDFSAPIADNNADYKEGNLLFKIRPEWEKAALLKSDIRNDILYIDARAVVLSYDFNLKTVSATPLKSLKFSDDMNLDYYFINDRAYLYNFRLGRDIGIFGGSQPEMSFEAFAVSNIIGRGKYDKIDTLFLYSDTGELIYRYKGIDDPMAIGDTGIIAEIDTEKDLTILSIEDPVKQEFFYVFDRGGK